MRKHILPIVGALFLCLHMSAQSATDIQALYNAGKAKQEAGDLAGAMSLYEQAIAAYPQEVDYASETGRYYLNAHYRKGVCAHDLGQYEIAAQSLNFVMENSVAGDGFSDRGDGEDNPSYHPSLRYLVYCNIKMSEMEMAKNHIRRLKDANFNPSEIAWLESLVATSEGRWDEAIDFANLAESAHLPTDTLLGHIQVQRARIHYRRGEYRDAIGECLMTLAVNPRSVDAGALKALAHIELNENQEAGDIITRITDAFPHNSRAKAALYWYKYRTGQGYSVVTDMAELVKNSPKSADTRYLYTVMAYSLNTINAEEALAHVDATLALEPFMEEALTLKSRLLYELGYKQEALSILAEAEKMGIHHSLSIYDAAHVYIMDKQPNKAMKKAKVAMDRGSDDEQFSELYGMMLSEQGKWGDALERFNKTLEINSNNWQALKGRGIALLRMGDASGAIADLATASTIRKDDPELAIEYGKALVATGDHSTAKEQFDLALSLDVNSPDAHFEMGRIYLERNNLKSAETAFQSALDIAKRGKQHEQLGMIHCGLGQVQAANGEYRQALQSYNAGLEISDHAELYANRARTQLALGWNNAALRDYGTALQISGGDPEYYYESGLVQRDTGLVWGAVSSLKKAVEAQEKLGLPVPDKYYFQRGVTYYLIGGGHLQFAEQDLLELRERGSDDWRVYYYLGMCHYNRENYNDALPYFDEAQTHIGELADIHIARGDAYSHMGQFAEAEKSYNTTVELHPNEPCYYKKKGLANLNMDNWLVAIKDYETAIVLNKQQGLPTDSETLHALARGYAGFAKANNSDKDYQEAINNFERALAADGVTDEQQYFIRMNMMLTYESWGKQAEKDALAKQLPGFRTYVQPAVMDCQPEN